MDSDEGLPTDELSTLREFASICGNLTEIEKEEIDWNPNRQTKSVQKDNESCVSSFEHQSFINSHFTEQPNSGAFVISSELPDSLLSGAFDRNETSDEEFDLGTIKREIFHLQTQRINLSHSENEDENEKEQQSPSQLQMVRRDNSIYSPSGSFLTENDDHILMQVKVDPTSPIDGFDNRVISSPVELFDEADEDEGLREIFVDISSEDENIAEISSPLVEGRSLSVLAAEVVLPPHEVGQASVEIGLSEENGFSSLGGEILSGADKIPPVHTDHNYSQSEEEICSLVEIKSSEDLNKCSLIISSIFEKFSIDDHLQLEQADVSAFLNKIQTKISEFETLLENKKNMDRGLGYKWEVDSRHCDEIKEERMDRIENSCENYPFSGETGSLTKSEKASREYTSQLDQEDKSVKNATVIEGNLSEENINNERKLHGNERAENDEDEETDIESPEYETEDVVLSEDVSEPLEFNRRNSDALSTRETEADSQEYVIETEKEITKLLSPKVDKITSELLCTESQKIKDLRGLASSIISFCDHFNESNVDGIEDAIAKQIKELEIKFKERKFTEVSVQTEYTGRIFTKERQKRINEKEKRKLLAESSSSESTDFCDTSSDGEFKKLSDTRLISPLQLPTTSTISASLTEQRASGNEDSEFDGLDLSKYVDNGNDGYDADAEEMTMVGDAVERSMAVENAKKELDGTSDKNCNSEKSEVEGKINDSGARSDLIEKQQVNKNLGKPESLNAHAAQECELVDNKNNNENLSEFDTDDDILIPEPIVDVNELSGEELEEYYDGIRDKEIDRLVDFDSLIRKKSKHLSSRGDKDTNRSSTIQVPKKREKLTDMFNGDTKDFSDDDEISEDEKDKMTEKQYLEQCNKGFKEKLLKSSSSDSDDSELEDNEESEASVCRNSDFSDSSLSNDLPAVDKFLENFKPEEQRNTKRDKNGEDTSNETSKSLAAPIEDGAAKLNGDHHPEIETEKGNTLTIVKTEGNANRKTNEGDGHESDHSSKSDDKAMGSRASTGKHLQRSLGISKHLLEDEFDVDAIASPQSAATKRDSDNSDCEILGVSKQVIQKRTLEDMLARSSKRTKLARTNDELISLSSESDSGIVDEIEKGIEDVSKQRAIKPMLRQDQLAGETKVAQRQETERIRRLEKKHASLNKALKEHESSTGKNDLILDYNSETKTFIKVHSDIVRHLKAHQVEGVKFMYDCCYGSIDHLKKHPGSGCILAHCMGLGKTLQLIALLHTLHSYPGLKTSKVLVLCPKSTVMNWKDEIQRWLGPLKMKEFRLFHFNDNSDIKEKLRTLYEWSTSGSLGFRTGCIIMGYEAFRTLVFYHLYKKKRGMCSKQQIESIQNKIRETLLEPGADLVICDEGHIIKNRKSAISSAVTEIKTPRRIILTGTPIQNNLKEYYAMVNFIKPSFLGTEKEFANLYANPIKAGQHKDSSKQDIKVMKQRSFVLHKKLSRFVQRKEAALLKTFLPEKYEYVVFTPLTEVQISLYQFFLETIGRREVTKGKSLITDYTCLRKIWTHAKVLENAWQNAVSKNRNIVPKTPTHVNSDDEVPDDVYDSQTGILSVNNDWWRPMVKEDDLESVISSNKLLVMFEILRKCEENGEKCLIFSAFVAVLNVVENFMKKMSTHKNAQGSPNVRGKWVPNEDYYRLDGKTRKDIRHEMIKNFNNPTNKRTRCFLISAKAGGQGINLTGANRVIILDTSWNPSNDQQNIFRIFRLGQKKKCYVYRLLAMGTMEEKVYSRSVTKQAMSFRVVDEQQIDRHYSMAELTELYTLTLANFNERPVPVLPQDTVLAHLLRTYPQIVFKYHEHDSLLENKLEQELSEQEKADAWEAYERDLIGQAPYIDNLGMLSQTPQQGMFPYGPYGMGFGLPPGVSDPMSAGMNNQLMGGFNFPNSALLDIYTMYQNFPGKGAPMMPSLMNYPPYSSNATAITGQPSSRGNPLLMNQSLLNNLPAYNSLSTLLNQSMYSAMPMTSSTPYPNVVPGSSDARLLESLKRINSGQPFPSSIGTNQASPFDSLHTSNPIGGSSINNYPIPAAHQQPKTSTPSSFNFGSGSLSSNRSAATNAPTSTASPLVSVGGQASTASIPISVIKDTNAVALSPPSTDRATSNHKRSTSPPGHIILKNPSQTSIPTSAGTSSASTLPSTSQANGAQQRPLVKNANMGIVYPGNAPTAPITKVLTAIPNAIGSVTKLGGQPTPNNIQVRSVTSINNSPDSKDSVTVTKLPPKSSISLPKDMQLISSAKFGSGPRVKLTSGRNQSIPTATFIPTNSSPTNVAGNRVGRPRKSTPSPVSSNLASNTPTNANHRQSLSIQNTTLTPVHNKQPLPPLTPSTPNRTAVGRPAPGNIFQNLSSTRQVSTVKSGPNMATSPIKMPALTRVSSSAGDKNHPLNVGPHPTFLRTSVNRSQNSDSLTQIPKITNISRNSSPSNKASISQQQQIKRPAGQIDKVTPNIQMTNLATLTPASTLTTNNQLASGSKIIGSIGKTLSTPGATAANKSLARKSSGVILAQQKRIANLGPRPAATTSIQTVARAPNMSTENKSASGSRLDNAIKTIGGISGLTITQNKNNAMTKSLTPMAQINAGNTLITKTINKMQPQNLLTTPRLQQQPSQVQTALITRKRPNSQALAVGRVSSPATSAALTSASLNAKQSKRLRVDGNVANKNVAESIRRIQTSQGLTVLPKNSTALRQDNHTEVVEID